MLRSLNNSTPSNFVLWADRDTVDMYSYVMRYAANDGVEMIAIRSLLTKIDLSSRWVILKWGSALPLRVNGIIEFMDVIGGADYEKNT